MRHWSAYYTYLLVLIASAIWVIKNSLYWGFLMTAETDEIPSLKALKAVSDI